MGNCLQSGGAAVGDGTMRSSSRRRGGGGGEEEDEAAAAASAGSVLKVKMVLTKAELEWLMAQLKAGDRRLEDVLHEMARKRDGLSAAGGDGWRPSLESIVEGPELTAFSFDY
ncbi:uncharacterized protein LOC107303578 [Oryza brachyantha]|uniref:uncharacterized protein LOC107303578 n=1 Tax=Oryza brachyantha TaxID=4533 RepID=UPI001ADB95D9|nr:uncharacterized protein LOC107303578 [Oryza brachyantha]